MFFAPGPRQFDLFLTLTEAGAVFIAELIDALMALHAGFELVAFDIFGCDGTAAGMAELMWAFFQAMSDRDAPVEDEAFAIPFAVPFRHLFEVFQDAAFEMIDIFDPFSEEVICGFLAADTAGAEHRDFLVVKPVFVVLPPRGKFTEGFGFWVDGAVKRADGHFVVVAGVDHGDVVAADQVIPVLGLHVIAGAGKRIDLRLAHGHDFAFQADFHAVEGHLGGGAFLVFKIGAAGQRADMGEKCIDAGSGACDGAIDPFLRDQQRALDALSRTELDKRRTQPVWIVEAREVIEGGNSEHGRSDTGASCAVQGVWLTQAGVMRSNFRMVEGEVRLMRDAKEALIVIDVQNDFCPGGALAVPGGDEIVQGINALMEEFQTIVLTQDWHPAGHSSFAASHPGMDPYSVTQMPYGPQVLWPDHCIQGSEGADFHEGLLTHPAQMIVRKGFRPDIDSYSAFFENDHVTPTGLEGYLRGRGVERLTIVGLATDFCVNFSAVDGARLRFDVTVQEELCRAIDLDGSLAAAKAGMIDAGVTLAG